MLALLKLNDGPVEQTFVCTYMMFSHYGWSFYKQTLPEAETIVRLVNIVIRVKHKNGGHLVHSYVCVCEFKYHLDSQKS